MNLTQFLANELRTVSMTILVINAIIHVLFAGAVAKDAGRMRTNGFVIQLVSPMTWAVATLIGGVIVAAIYWAIHHISFQQR